jgi:hypothetical protein
MKTLDPVSHGPACSLMPEPPHPSPLATPFLASEPPLATPPLRQLSPTKEQERERVCTLDKEERNEQVKVKEGRRKKKRKESEKEKGKNNKNRRGKEIIIYFLEIVIHKLY